MAQEISPIKARLRAYSASKTPNSGSKEKELSPISVISEIETSKDSSRYKNQKENSDTSSVEKPEEEMAGKNGTLEEMMANLTATVNSIKTDIADLKGNKTKLTTIENTQIIEANERKKLVERQDSDSLKLKMLMAIVIRQDKQIQHMKNEMEVLKKESKKSTVLIEGLIESDKEKTSSGRIEVVSDFFKEKMEIKDTVRIKQAYRYGKKIPQTMKVVLENPEDKSIIFSHVSNLKGKKNVRRKLYFIKDDLTPEQQEIKDYYRSLQKENQDRPEGKRLQIKLHKGNLLVNNKKIQKEVEAPQVSNILTLDDAEIHSLHEIRTHEGGQHQEGDSEFFCHYQKITDTNDAEAGYAKMKIKYGDATHIAAAYRLEGADGPFKQGYDDDGEEGAGRKILQELKESDTYGTAIFIARYFGKKKLGSQRFEIYSHLAKSALKSKKARAEKLKRANRLRRSGSQLSQLSQLSSFSQESLNADPGELIAVSDVPPTDETPDVTDTEEAT